MNIDFRALFIFQSVFESVGDHRRVYDSDFLSRLNYFVEPSLHLRKLFRQCSLDIKYLTKFGPKCEIDLALNFLLQLFIELDLNHFQEIGRDLRFLFLQVVVVKRELAMRGLLVHLFVELLTKGWLPAPRINIVLARRLL